MEPILRTDGIEDWITILLITSIVFLVLAKSIFYNRFMNFAILPFNNKYIFMYNRKEKLMNWFHIFFTIFQIINLALFIFLTIRVLAPKTQTFMLPTFLIILGSLILFASIKVGLQLANGFIFGSIREIGELVFKKISYLNYSAIVMFLANMIMIYVIKDSKVVVFTSILLILLINVIGWVTVLRNHQKFITNYFFYFILYLCALEISPFIIISSYLNKL